MKYISFVIRLFVGGLFIFSGLIKINDPVGTAIKMEEYFDVFSVEFASFFHVFVPLALPISIFLVVLEVVLGVALILNYRAKITIYLLLSLIVFFTLLTGYSAVTNTVTDCGCFGDAIKLTPWESFTKDLVLLVLIIALLILPNISQSSSLKKISNYTVIGTTAVSFGLAYWAIAHLPFLDFRAYKIGNHIPTEMQPSAPYIYEYVMEKDGKQHTFDTYPTDKSYKYVAMNHVNPEAAPKITDFAVWNDDGDYTEETFQGAKLFIISYDLEKADMTGLKEIVQLTESISDKITVNLLTASDGALVEKLNRELGLDIPYYFADATVLKTIARSNPAVWMLNDGEVVGKWHYNDTPGSDKVLSLSK